VPSSDWARYYAAAGDTPRDTLRAALDAFAEPGFAVDLGCGAGRDTVELLRRGWRVLAIDAEPEAIEHLLARVDDARLATQVSRFEDARWPAAELVNSSFALPFCPPAAFPDVWSRLVESVLPGGRFSGHLFGDRDEWSGESDMTFHTRAEAEAILDAFELERFDEVDEDGTTAVGDAKHWHLFHVVARKR
jgi:tellurite methyltransferase